MLALIVFLLGSIFLANVAILLRLSTMNDQIILALKQLSADIQTLGSQVGGSISEPQAQAILDGINAADAAVKALITP